MTNDGSKHDQKIIKKAHDKSYINYLFCVSNKK